MPICIYCKKSSESSRGIPHVLPQALARNELQLSRGVECDQCNEYAGKRLDANLIRYPAVAFGIQVAGAPGKKGRPRVVGGGVRREALDARTVRVRFKVRGRISAFPPNLVVAQGRIVPVPEFDFLCFRRALHHMALNAFAARSGPQAALRPEFEAVRQYVRNPNPPDDSWPYGQVEPKFKEIPRRIAAQEIEFEGADLIGIHVFQLLFVVDLLRTGVLERATRVLGGRFVPADATEPPEAIIQAGGRVRA
jgi:hypothetical protein